MININQTVNFFELYDHKFTEDTYDMLDQQRVQEFTLNIVLTLLKETNLNAWLGLAILENENPEEFWATLQEWINLSARTPTQLKAAEYYSTLATEQKGYYNV